MSEFSFADFAPQGSSVQLIQRELSSGSFPHASLILGSQGAGKKTLARLIASALLCREKNPPCGKCPDCQLAEKLEHPNLILVRAGEPIADGVSRGRTTIPVDDIREVVRRCGERTLDRGKRVILIWDADRMTPQAQNALLKTLEEPPADTHFLLTTEHMENVLTTVISRCQRISLHPWPEEAVVRGLKARGVEAARAAAAARVAEGSIGKAILHAEDDAYWAKRKEWSSQFFGLSRHGDILALSGAWKDRKGEADELLQYLEEQFQRMLRHRMNPEIPLISDEIPKNWRELAEGAQLGTFSRLLDLIVKARREKEANVNFQAVIEQLLFGMLGELNQWQK